MFINELDAARTISFWEHPKECSSVGHRTKEFHRKPCISWNKLNCFVPSMHSYGSFILQKLIFNYFFTPISKPFFWNVARTVQGACIHFIDMGSLKSWSSNAPRNVKRWIFLKRPIAGEWPLKRCIKSEFSLICFVFCVAGAFQGKCKIEFSQNTETEVF